MADQTDPLTTDAARWVTITLDQAHTHQRTAYPAGDTIDVAPHVADYLEQRKIGQRTPD